MTGKSLDLAARFLDYSPETKLLVVGQKNVLGKANDPYATGCQVIRVFAKALYYVTGTRPVDPNWDSRPRRIWQQYELGLQRMDVRFDAKLKETYDSAMNKGLWKGTAAVNNRVEYWAEGVLAYFDATGLGAPPNPRFRGDKLAPAKVGGTKKLNIKKYIVKARCPGDFVAKVKICSGTFYELQQIKNCRSKRLLRRKCNKRI